MRSVTIGASVMVLGLVGCTVNPSTGRSQFLLLSVEQAQALGEESKLAVVEQYGGELESTQVTTYVQRVGRSMAGFTEADYPDLPWEFTVLDSDVINAFALPGGKVFASRGLLVRLDNEAELAGVLGHEIGHVTAQHVNERISQAILISGIVVGASVAADSSDSEWAAVLPIVVGAAGQGYLLSFNRNQESEADEQGIKYMTAAGYDPGAMIELLEVLRDAGDGFRPPEFLSTHPYPETRIETVSRLLGGPYAYTQGNPDFRKFPDRYRQNALRYLPATEQAALTATGPGWCAVCGGSEKKDPGSLCSMVTGTAPSWPAAPGSR